MQTAVGCTQSLFALLVLVQLVDDGKYSHLQIRTQAILFIAFVIYFLQKVVTEGIVVFSRAFFSKRSFS